MSGYVIWNSEYGYYTGNISYSAEFGLFYPGGEVLKTNNAVKVYKFEKRAINAAENLKKKCHYFEDYKILPKQINTYFEKNL